MNVIKINDDMYDLRVLGCLAYVVYPFYRLGKCCCPCFCDKQKKSKYKRKTIKGWDKPDSDYDDDDELVDEEYGNGYEENNDYGENAYYN